MNEIVKKYIVKTFLQRLTDENSQNAIFTKNTYNFEPYLNIQND